MNEYRNEVGQFIDLCEVVMETYIAVDSLDLGDDNYGNREVKVDKVLNIIYNND